MVPAKPAQTINSPQRRKKTHAPQKYVQNCKSYQSWELASIAHHTKERRKKAKNAEPTHAGTMRNFSRMEHVNYVHRIREHKVLESDVLRMRVLFLNRSCWKVVNVNIARFIHMLQLIIKAVFRMNVMTGSI